MAIQLRAANATVAVKHEVTAGTDIFSGSPNVSTDFLKVADLSMSFQQQGEQTNELTGSLDVAPPIPSGTRVSVTFTCLLRGSGTPETPPQWGKLLEMSAWKKVITSAAVGAPTAATAGSATTVTADTPFGSTAQAYRGMPILLGTNPAGGATDFVTDYTSGKIVTLGRASYSPVLDSSTTLQIPKNVLYVPTSDDSDMQSGTIYIYRDGLRYKMVGCQGQWQLTLTDARVGRIQFTMQGVFLGIDAASIPANLVFDAPVPPNWLDGVSRINRGIARCAQMQVSSGNTLFDPENPEAPEGYDPSLVVSRQVTGTIDPFTDITGTQAVLNAFKAGTTAPIVASLGSVAGNRFGIVIPTAQYTSYGQGDRGGLLTDQIGFGAVGQDTGAFIACF